MALTTTQQQTLKTAILADGTLNTLPPNSDSAFTIAVAFNQTDVSATKAWWTSTPVVNIFDSITWANYTPNDAPDSTVTYSNRSLNIQTKQMNLQNMLVGRITVDASKDNFRAGLRDAVINLPAGTGGAFVQAAGASGVTALTACLRPSNATRAEKLFSGGSHTTGTVTADVLIFEGSLAFTDVMVSMGW